MEAEGTAGMDDRRNDGRGARMASSAEGMEGGGIGKDEGGRMKDELPNDSPTLTIKPPMPVAEDSRSEPSGPRSPRQRRPRKRAANRRSVKLQG